MPPVDDDATPDFRSREFLRRHIRDTMAFYHPRAIDPAGGFFHYFRDDGSVYDASHRHLVSSTRFVFNYAMAAREFGNAEYVEAARPFVEAVRAASPHPVKVALSAAVNTFWGGPNKRGDDWQQQDAMIQAFVDEAQRQGFAFDALQYHGYPSYPVREGLAGNAYAERLFRTRLLPALARAPFPIEVWNDEFHAASSGRGSAVTMTVSSTSDTTPKRTSEPTTKVRVSTGSPPSTDMVNVCQPGSSRAGSRVSITPPRSATTSWSTPPIDTVTCA